MLNNFEVNLETINMRVEDNTPVWTPHFDNRNERFSLLSMLATERAGAGSHVESFLKQVLRMRGNTLHNNVLHWREISPDIRQEWQRMGIDPDSENEVLEYLNQQNSAKIRKP